MRKEGRATVVIPTLAGEGGHYAWDLKAIDPALFPDPADRFEEELKDFDWETTDTESSISNPRYLRVEIAPSQLPRINAKPLRKCLNW
jgi:hypothetical protein